MFTNPYSYADTDTYPGANAKSDSGTNSDTYANSGAKSNPDTNPKSGR